MQLRASCLTIYGYKIRLCQWKPNLIQLLHVLFNEQIIIQKMQIRNLTFGILVLLLGCGNPKKSSSENASVYGPKIDAWITSADRSKLLFHSNLDFNKEIGRAHV